jgi:transposase
LSPQACSKWRLRFAAAGLEGLRDRPRAGRPMTIAPATRLAVLERATETPPDGRTRWTQRQLARVVGISPASVNRVLNAGDLKPHKTEYWCGRSPDPRGWLPGATSGGRPGAPRAAKQAAILGLYLDPPSGALVLSVDEKSQIQALDRTQPELPLRPGRPRRLTATYRRNGTTCLVAALSIATGTVEARCLDRATHQEFLAFLKHLYRRHPGRELHIILDNLSVHKHATVLAWAARRRRCRRICWIARNARGRRLQLHFTPTYASWLNQIEIWFRILTKAVVKDGVWPSKAQLVAQIMTFIKDYNATRAHPFRWTYTGQPLAA